MKVDLFKIIQQLAVHLAQREGFGSEAGWELEWDSNFTPLLASDNSLQTTQIGDLCSTAGHKLAHV